MRRSCFRRAGGRPLHQATDSRLHSAAEKELLCADRYLDNLARTSGWRLRSLVKNAGYCRQALDKALALQGHTGNPLVDLLCYLVQVLPLLVPSVLLLIPGLFLSLVALVSSQLSEVTMEPQVIEKEVSVPIFRFFSITKTITETVMIPVTHSPDHRVAVGIACLMVFLSLLALSYLLKMVFRVELQFRRRLVLQRRGSPTAADESF